MLLKYFSIFVATLASWLFFICQNEYQWGGVHFEESPLAGSVVGHGYNKSNVYVRSELGGNIHCWLLTSDSLASGDKVPAVVLSHGLGSQKDMGLENYAGRFVEAGFIAVVLDYRYFGGSYSESEPELRNYINPWNHVADIKTVVNAIVRGDVSNSIDTTSIALWGTSFAGGHVLHVSRDLGSKIKCVISQVPHLDGKEASKRGIAERGFIGTLKLGALVIADAFVSHVLGLPPIYVKIAGLRGEVAYMMMSKSELSSYFQKHPKVYLGGWKNLAPARTLGIMSLYNPILAVKDIRAPILFIAAKNDHLCPLEYVRKAHHIALSTDGSSPQSKLLEIDSTHFDIYTGEHFEYVVKQTIDFLKTHLTK